MTRKLRIGAPGLPMRFSGILIMVVLSMVCAYPFVWLLISSIRPSNTIFNGPFIPEQLDFSSYSKAWTETNFGQHLLNSILITSISLTGIMLLSTAAGYAFSKLNFPFKNSIFLIMMSTMMMPTTSLLIPLYLQLKSYHLLDSMAGLILVYIGSMSPFSIFLMRAFFQVVPNELIQAARIDGAGEFKIFTRIALPLVKSGIGTVVIFQFLAIWNEFIYATVFIQDESRQPLQPAIFNLVGFYSTNWSPLTAALVMAIVPIVIVYVKMQKQFVAGLTLGSVKS